MPQKKYAFFFKTGTAFGNIELSYSKSNLIIH